MIPDKDHPTVAPEAGKRPAASAPDRQDVLEFVLHTLTTTGTRFVLLCGGRLEAKTPLLRWLAGMLADRFAPVYINPVRWPPLLPDEVLPFLVKTLGQALHLEMSETASFSAPFCAAADAILGGRRLVLLLDELSPESLTHSAMAASVPIFVQLQEVTQHWPALSIVTVLSRRLHEIDAEFLAGLREAKVKYLNPLSPDDIRLMAESSGLHLDGDAITRLEAVSAGQPYVVSWLCGALAQHAGQLRQDSVRASDVDLVLEQGITTEEPGLVAMWQALDVPERLLLIVLAQQSAGPVRADSLHAALAGYGIQLAGVDLTAALGRLAEMGLLIRRPGAEAYAFGAEAMRRWIVMRFPVEGVREALEKISLRAVQEYGTARAQHDHGDLTEAVAGYRRTLAINPNHCLAWLSLGQALSERGEIAGAVEAFERAYDLDHALSRDALVAALTRYGQLLQSEKNDDAAVHVYRRLLTLVPDDLAARHNLFAILSRRAETFLARSDMERAREAFRRALELEPGNPTISARLAEVSARRQAAAAVLAETPTNWGGREWKAIGGLATALLVVGVVFFAVSRGGLSVPTVVAPTASVTTEAAYAVAVSPTTLPATRVVMLATPSEIVITPTPLFSATVAPVPADTITPMASATPLPTHTLIPSPTPRLVRTSTPTRKPTDTPTLTNTPTATPSPTPTATPTMALEAPRLLGPDQGSYFSGAETRIELRWAPVGTLASNEWYGLSVRYRHAGQSVETGSWMKDTRWVVSPFLAGQADEPERKYQWDVVVVRELEPAADGARRGIEISPRSETRSFVWR